MSVSGRPVEQFKLHNKRRLDRIRFERVPSVKDNDSATL